MSSRDWKLRVQDILSAIAGVQRRTANITFAEFQQNETVVKAVLYDFLIIGEATRNIPTEIQTGYDDIPWRFMHGMRNVVAHEYFQIGLEVIWKTLQEDLPLLVPQLQELLERETQGE